MDDDGRVVKKTVGGILGVCGLLIALIVTSMAVVAPTEYGLRYNNIFLSIADNADYPGRKWVWPWKSMIIFPSTAQTIEFSSRSIAQAGPLRTRTDEGLDLTIHVSFQYKLFPQDLTALYLLYKQSYEPIFVRQAASVLLSVASQYEAQQYWTNRLEIGQSMQAQLRELFVGVTNVTDLQLMIVDLPTSFENKIVDTEVQKQIRKTREAQKEAAVIRAEIDVMLADFAKQTQIILRGADAQSTLLTRTAEAQAQKARIDVETEALLTVDEKIPLSSGGQVSYQRGIAYQNVDAAQFMFGVQQAAAIVNTAGHMQSHAKICDKGGAIHTDQPARMLSANVEETSEILKDIVTEQGPLDATEMLDEPDKKLMEAADMIDAPIFP